MDAGRAYEEKLVQEAERYRTVTNVHDLPAAHHYWADRYLTPRLNEVGIDFNTFYSGPVAEMCPADPSKTIAVVSLGSGNGDIEAGLAKQVLDRGYDNFVIDCIEMNSAMQERARTTAEELGVDAHMRFESADLNSWKTDKSYDVAMASHSLHHVVELEHLFGQVRSALTPDGVFLINDMIGRNGHQRWPEALRILGAIWAAAPDRYKFNHQTEVLDVEFPNYDCSVDGFEGIRAQDILPLLLSTFHPDQIVGFSNIIDVFCDRAYGHNFDVEDPEDQRFLDSVAQLDEQAIDLGIVKPTHMIATFRVREVASPRYSGVRDPWFCVRNTEELDKDATIIELVREGERLKHELVAARAKTDRLLRSKTWRYTRAPRAAYRRLKRMVLR